jgi:hypothetical protein
MNADPLSSSLEDSSSTPGIRSNDSDGEKADDREIRVSSRRDTPERLLGSGPDHASADLDPHDPRESGILIALHDKILGDFMVLLRRLAKGAQEPAGTRTPRNAATEGCTEPIGLNISDPTTVLQYASLQRSFIRFSIWGRESGVDSGALEKSLESSQDLREDIILVLLQLCDALYRGKCT